MKKPVILIVDDEPANQFLLEGLLSANNYEPLVVGSGAECLALLENHNPDLILLDIMMPKMTGIQVLERIVVSEQWKTIPVIMVSAKTASADIQEALIKGAIDYIKKPFDEMELLARVKVAIRLKMNEDNLRDMIHQRNDFVKIISHDLRSPFTAIQGFAEILLNDDNLSIEQRTSLEYIIKSVEYSDEYFNKLLSWSMLEHSDLELSPSTFPVHEFFNNILSIFQVKASDKQIVLRNISDTSTQIKADETFFRQAISNLVNNAIKFTNKGGEIQCFTENISEGIALIVSDDGIGMPEHITNENLFGDKLVSSQRGTSGEKGTGVGLSICKKILEEHGFDIRFDSNDRGGTDFIITIPDNAK